MEISPISKAVRANIQNLNLQYSKKRKKARCFTLLNKKYIRFVLFRQRCYLFACVPKPIGIVLIAENLSHSFRYHKQRSNRRGILIPKLKVEYLACCRSVSFEYP